MKKFIFFVLCLNFSAASAKTLHCRIFLSDDRLTTEDSGGTQNFISYLGYLLDQNIIGEIELRNLIYEIENQQELSNPVPHKITPHEVTFVQSKDRIHYENIQAYLMQNDFERDVLLNWTTAILQRSKRVKEKRSDKQKATKNPFYEMEFHRLKGGWILGHDIEVMSTLVTQAMWVDEMGENPAHNKNSPNRVSLLFKKKAILLQPDNPVEYITWYSAAMFANRFSVKYGLKEAYDFSDVQFKTGTSAEKGDLDIVSGEVKINASSIHETEGYRLPTEIEQAFLMRDQWHSKTDYFTGVTAENLHEYAWFGVIDSQPIKEKKSFVIQGKEFFDLYGNVYEWGNAESELDYTIKPRQKTKPTFRVSSGGKWGPEKEASSMIAKDHRYFPKTNYRSQRLGLRLVRTVK